MRTIIYENGIKHTTAVGSGAQYRKLSPEDYNWLLATLRQVKDLFDQFDALDDQTARDFMDSMRQRRSDLPKQGQHGRIFRQNSIDSFVNGILENFESTQRDFSEKVCAGIEVIMRELTNSLDIPELEEVVFEKGVLPKRVLPKLPKNTVEVPVHDILDPNHLFDFGDLTITITVSRKK
jgi:hypothetical protein